MTEPTTCAIYARYSSTRQRPASIEDQIRVCRRYASDQGWKVLDEHIYIDQAISGDFIAPRDSLKRMLSEATSGRAPFVRILVDDTSRVARNTQEALEIFSLLDFYDVHVSYVTQGIDTASETAEDLITINGLADSRYLKMLARETHRGVEGRVMNGFSGGGRRYGYRSEPVFSGRVDIYGQPEADGYRLVIKPDEADTVVRIFRMYAEEKLSGKRIAKLLNEEFVKIGSPVPPNGNAWTVNTIQGGRTALRGILNNEIYIGNYYWNKTAVKKSPDGRKKVVFKNREHWRLAEHPELRIVPDELWEKAQARRQAVRKSVKSDYWKGRSFYTTNLLTGVIKCAHCGGNIVTIYGGKYGKYGCSNNWNKGDAICSNDTKVQRAELDGAVAEVLQRLLGKPEVSKSVQRRVNELLASRKEDEEATWRRRALQRDLRAAERDIKNVEQAIRSGFIGETVCDLMEKSERAKRDLTEKLDRLEQEAGRSKVIPVARIAEYMEDVFGLLGRHPEAGKGFIVDLVGELIYEGGDEQVTLIRTVDEEVEQEEMRRAS